MIGHENLTNIFNSTLKLLIGIMVGILLILIYDMLASYSYVVRTLKNDPMIHFNEPGQ